MEAVKQFFVDFGRKFTINFIEENRWRYLTDGLLNTLMITLGAVILGFFSALSSRSCVLPTTRRAE